MIVFAIDVAVYTNVGVMLRNVDAHANGNGGTDDGGKGTSIATLVVSLVVTVFIIVASSIYGRRVMKQIDLEASTSSATSDDNEDENMLEDKGGEEEDVELFARDQIALEDFDSAHAYNTHPHIHRRHPDPNESLLTSIARHSSVFSEEDLVSFVWFLFAAIFNID